MKNKKIMILDGSSLLYRGFYALPLLMTKDGVYTNGVYGFLTMFYRVMEEKEPDYVSIVFDKSGPTFRHEEYKEYKGTRKSTPSELVQQFPMIREILEAMNVKFLELSGFEADDIAGTLAKIGEEKGLEVILVTGDKDYLQLATDKTKVLITRKGISDMEEFDYDKILETYEITPDQLIDLKGLMGDQSDNIPGVPGIGEKTGLKLLKEYGTIENVYENIDNITAKKLNENLRNHKDLAYLSRKLGEIVTNVPMEFKMEDFKIVEPDWENLMKIYEKLEFNSFIKKFSGEYTPEEEELNPPIKYNLIESSGYDDLIDKIKKEGKFAFKFALSDDNYVEDHITTLAIKTEKLETSIIEIENNKEDFVKKFKSLFEDESVEKIGHNLKSDIVVLSRLGIEVENIEFDSMIAQYLIDPAQSTYSINDISKEYLDYYGVDSEALFGKGKNRRRFSDLSQEETCEYLSYILDTVVNVEDKMKDLLKSQEMMDLYYDVELPLVKVLASMEFSGFEIDKDELNKLGDEYKLEIDSLTNEIHEFAEMEFNINSPKQLGEVLFEKMGLPVIKKTKTGYSTAADVLDKLKDQHPIIEKVLRYRQIVKLKSTYIDGLLALINKDTNRVHSSFNQTITTTGRISSTEPNLQNIPIRTSDGRKIRKAFIAKDDKHTLIDADYSQIELRVLAHISQDPKLMEAFINNQDIHQKTASEVFHVDLEDVTPELRDSAKAVNFGIVYGISDYGLSVDLNISRKEAKEYIDNYLENYKLVKQYMEDIVKEGKENGFVETILHRRRYIPELAAKNFNIKSFGERIAMNTPIQGSAADIIKMAMVQVYNELKKRNLKSRLILQVHDELIIESPRDEIEEVKEILKNLMENAIKLDVPLIADLEVGDSWYDTK